MARARQLALHYLEANEGAHAFNLRNGQGFSVREVIKSARVVTHRDIGDDGDPAVLVTSSDKARREFGLGAGEEERALGAGIKSNLAVEQTGHPAMRLRLLPLALALSALLWVGLNGDGRG